jgi:RDD family
MEPKPAALWQRYIAQILELFIFVPLIIVLFPFVVGQSKEVFIYLMFFFWIFDAVYTIYFTHRYGAAIGGLIIGIRYVKNITSSKLTPLQSVEYFIASRLFHIISSIFALITLFGVSIDKIQGIALENMTTLAENPISNLFDILGILYILFNIWYFMTKGKKQMWYDKKLDIICIKK